MKALTKNQKHLFIGGAKKISYNKAKSLTKWNNNLFNSGQIALAIASTSEYLGSTIPKLISVIKGDEESYRSLNQKETALLRPRFQFSKNYWSSSMSYGGTWFF